VRIFAPQRKEESEYLSQSYSLYLLLLTKALREE